MIRSSILILGLIVLNSCNSGNDIPSGVLKADKMQAVLWDIIKADVFTDEFIKKDSTKNAATENLKLQQQVFAIHKISKTEFYKSYDFYKSNTPLFKVMLDSMIAQAERNKNNNITKPLVAE